jgi:hypothetical protein
MIPDAEVRTRSVPVSAHLLLQGYTPLGVKLMNGSWYVRFSPAARDALNAYLKAKADIDLLIEEAIR